jgi:hypothetical protein
MINRLTRGKAACKGGAIGRFTQGFDVSNSWLRFKREMKFGTSSLMFCAEFNI